LEVKNFVVGDSEYDEDEDYDAGNSEDDDEIKSNKKLKQK
jgi:hypothetical protein